MIEQIAPAHNKRALCSVLMHAKMMPLPAKSATSFLIQNRRPGPYTQVEGGGRRPGVEEGSKEGATWRKRAEKGASQGNERGHSSD